TDARTLDEAGGVPDPTFAGGGAIVAAACIRDHISEMEADETEWCCNKIRQTLEDSIRDEGPSPYERGRVPDRSISAVVGLLVAEAPEVVGDDPYDFLAAALSHWSDEVTDYGYAGVGQFVGAGHEELVLRCAAAAVVEARDRHDRMEAERRTMMGESVDEDSASLSTRAAVRGVLAGSADEARSILAEIDLTTWTGRRAATRVARILASRPGWSESKAFFKLVADWVASVWSSDRGQSGGHRDFHGEKALEKELARFVLSLPGGEAVGILTPVIDCVASEPREVEDVLHSLILAADGATDDSFWSIWQAIADRALEAPWLERLDAGYSGAESLIRRLFLETYWKDDVSHWDRLDGEAHRVDGLAAELTPAGITLTAYARFLYSIGQQSLPRAFLVLDAMVTASPQAMGHADALFMLETMLVRFVYGEPHRLKSDPDLRGSVLRLLDSMVSAGSSAAYRMRDDFVTPERGAGDAATASRNGSPA
ncbi:MAG: hypothetical protein L7S64_00985, partial [Longimicrobiales bacterium]|nr:hypothetical protein [Longimicrobiales bacterium]